MLFINKSRYLQTLALLTFSFAAFTANQPAKAAIRYVNATASGANNGASWTSAFTSLQSALNVAVAGDQIWVTEGIYKPTQREIPVDPRSATFKLKSGVAVYGGFAGTESSPAQRQPGQHITILSGDLAGNDGSNFANDDENAYHVVLADGTDPSTLFDGFTITAGHADGTHPGYHSWDSGGGMHIGDLPPNDGHLTVRDCVFYRNRANSGGGIYNLEGNPTLFRCLFLENSAQFSGGGVGCCDDTSAAPTVLNCRFIANSANSGGGWDSGENASPFFMNCLFSGNTALYGGGFSGCCGQNSMLASCTFSGNHAASQTGGARDVIRAVNCIFWGNTDFSGETLNAQLSGNLSGLNIASCCIQDVSSPLNGTNFGQDPLFEDPEGPDNVLGTLDDNLRLSSGSPYIDTGLNRGFCGLPPSSGSGSFGHACDFVTDLDNHDRYIDDPASSDCAAQSLDCGLFPIIDIGAYEFNLGTPPTQFIGDLNCDEIVDFSDIQAFVIAAIGRDAYYAAYPNCRRSQADTNDDGRVDGRDFQAFTALLINP